MLDKKVYSAWAFQENNLAKRDINAEIYEELKRKYKITFKQNKTEEELKDYDIVLDFIRVGYAHNLYGVCKKPSEITDDELALLCDEGNLCFGYTKEKGDYFHIYTD